MIATEIIDQLQRDVARLQNEIEDMHEAVAAARESRDKAESDAKAAVQTEMAKLRAARCPRCKEQQPPKIEGPVLFLDVDGVLNDNRSSGIDPQKTEILNTVIYRCLNLKLVISSAWRHEIIGGDMTFRGFETMLRACGLRAGGRVIGVTDDDGNDFENDGRAKLIRRFVAQHGIKHWAAIDDMQLALPPGRFVRTDGDVGITAENAAQLLAIFTGCAIVTK